VLTQRASSRLVILDPSRRYPFYLFRGSPGHEGSHFDPDSKLFVPSERKMVNTTNAFLIGWLGVLAACTFKLGIPAMLGLYFMPYAVFVMWLDAVTYLHHHGSDNPTEKMPWYRGEEWNYMRGGLTTLDRDYGIFNKVSQRLGRSAAGGAVAQQEWRWLSWSISRDGSEEQSSVPGPQHWSTELRMALWC